MLRFIQVTFIIAISNFAVLASASDATAPSEVEYLVDILTKSNLDLEVTTVKENCAAWPILYGEDRQSDLWTLVSFETVIDCLNTGQIVDARDQHGATALMWASGNSKNLKIIDLLLKRYSDVNIRSEGGMTALHLAAMFNDDEQILMRLIEAGANINARNKIGQTPLHLAALKNPNPKVIRVLLESGANGAEKTAKGKTPFDLAKNNNPKIVGTYAYWALNDAQYE